MPVFLQFNVSAQIGHIVQSRYVDGAWQVRVNITAPDKYATFVHGQRAQLTIEWDAAIVVSANIARYQVRITSFSVVRESTLPGASWLGAASAAL